MSDATLRAILEESSKNTKAKAGSVDQKIGDFYATCMDEQKREAEGAKPLAPYLARIEKVNDLKSLEAQLAYSHSEGLPMFCGFGSGPDFKNSSMQIATAGQGGISLPNKDYYTKTDEKSVKLREQYVQHVAAMFQLLGDAPDVASKNAQTVMSIETRLAQNSRGPVELRDPTTQYHLMTVAELDKLTPHFSWENYFAGLSLPRDLKVNVAHPEFFEALDKALVEIPVADWKTYFAWHVLASAAPALSRPFVDESFAFFGK